MDLAALIAEQNPWWEDPARRAATHYPVRRDLQPVLLERLLDTSDRRAHLVLGPRQVGKTTLLQQTLDDLLDSGLPPANVTYFDFSDDRIAGEPSAREVAEVLPVALAEDRPRFLLLDEVHFAPGWDRWLKQAVDRTGWRILATDSAASVLREAARESGQGRWDEHFLEGLSFSEFANLQGPPDRTVDEIVELQPNLFERYVALGGFPEHATSDDLPRVHRRLRTDIVERALFRDLGPHVDDPAAVRDLFVYLVRSSGAILNTSGLADDLGNDSRSIRRWLDLLEQTFLVAALPRHGRRASSNLRARPKLFAADHGLVSAFAVPAADELGLRGRVFETMVYRHLRPLARRLDSRLAYFRPKESLEIDFVLEPPAAGPIAIEVTASRQPKPRKIERLRTAASELGTEHAVLIHDAATELRPPGVTALPLERFLLDPSAVLGERADG